MLLCVYVGELLWEQRARRSYQMVPFAVSDLRIGYTRQLTDGPAGPDGPTGPTAPLRSLSVSMSCFIYHEPYLRPLL